MQQFEIRILNFIKNLLDSIFEYWFVVFGIIWMINGITFIVKDDEVTVKKVPQTEQVQQAEQTEQEVKKEDGPKPSF